MLPDGLSVTTLLPPLDGQLITNSGPNLHDNLVARFGRTEVGTKGAGVVGGGLETEGVTVASVSGSGSRTGTAVGMARTEDSSVGTVAASGADGRAADGGGSGWIGL